MKWWVWLCDGTVLRQVGEVVIPRPQKMANNLQRQGRSARLAERRSHCTEKLLAGWKFAFLTAVMVSELPIARHGAATPHAPHPARSPTYAGG